MGGGGSIAGMITSFKNNRNLQNRNKERRREVFIRLKEKTNNGNIKLSFKHLSEHELQVYKLMLRRKKYKENIKIALLIVIISVIVFLVLNYLLNFTSLPFLDKFSFDI